MISLLPSALPPARRLLKRLRDVMAGKGSASERLDKIVHLIAAELGADVCSCYVMRAGEVLELHATHGLKQEAVRKTRLRVGEGIVGGIAATAVPLALANAPLHPNFAYRPETGEDPFHSMMGVPILRGGKVRGVLTIQHRARRQYSEEEIELLETIAMIVAEIVTGGEIVSANEISPSGDPHLMPQRIEGRGMNAGVAAGRAVLHRPQMTVREMIAENIPQEIERLRTALKNLHDEIEAILEIPHLALRGEPQEILETYRIFAADRGWSIKLEDAVHQGLTAAAAVQKVQNDYRARFAQMADPLLRDRLADFDDLAERLLRHLNGDAMATTATLPDNAILIARHLGPAELLDYDTTKIRGLVLEGGSNSSHVTILARALDIPVIGQCPNIMTQIEPLDPLIINGKRGIVFIRPSEDIQQEFTRALDTRRQRNARLAELRDLPARTKDGMQISVGLNCGLLMDFDHLDTTQADGVGLYRTEIPFMLFPHFPDVAEQTEIYRQAFEHAEGRPLHIRTLDAGGDKMLPYMAANDQENPALGWRAIRIGLDRPSLLRQQIRAILAAAEDRELRLMFPMVATVAELVAAREILDLELSLRRAKHLPLPTAVRVGVIVEVPSLIWQLPALLPHIDFLSIGSNDLLQYVFAADRGNDLVSRRYDPLSPAFLLMIRELVACCAVAEKPLSICGEMASRPLEAMTLLGLGVRALSVTPTAFVAIKTMVRSLDAGALAAYLATQILKPDPTLRSKLRGWAADHGVILS